MLLNSGRFVFPMGNITNLFQMESFSFLSMCENGPLGTKIKNQNTLLCVCENSPWKFLQKKSWRMCVFLKPKPRTCISWPISFPRFAGRSIYQMRIRFPPPVHLLKFDRVASLFFREVFCSPHHFITAMHHPDLLEITRLYFWNANQPNTRFENTNKRRNSLLSSFSLFVVSSNFPSSNWTTKFESPTFAFWPAAIISRLKLSRANESGCTFFLTSFTTSHNFC